MSSWIPAIACERSLIGQWAPGNALGPVMETEFRVKTFLQWAVVGTALGVKRPLCHPAGWEQSPGESVFQLCWAIASAHGGLLLKITFPCVGESTNLNLSFFWTRMVMFEVVWFCGQTVLFHISVSACWRSSQCWWWPQMFCFQSESTGSSIFLSH